MYTDDGARHTSTRGCPGYHRSTSRPPCITRLHKQVLPSPPDSLGHATRLRKQRRRKFLFQITPKLAHLSMRSNFRRLSVSFIPFNFLPAVLTSVISRLDLLISSPGWGGRRARERPGVFSAKFLHGRAISREIGDVLV